MTFLAYLAAQPDHNARMLASDLSGIADGANDLGVIVAHLRATLRDSEAVLAVEEAEYRWDRYVEESPLRNMRALAVRVPRLPKRISRKSSPDPLTSE